MASPTATRMPRARRRAQLLELATRTFSEHGYQATSMDDIAAVAGVTKPVLYQHFASKETLYLEVIDVLTVRLLEEVRELSTFRGGTLERVRHGLDRFYRFVSLENALRLFTGHEQISEAVRDRVDDVLDRMARELTVVLTAARRIPPAQARALGRGYIALAQTTALLLHEAANESEREEILDVMSVAMVRGLTGFAPLDNPRVTGTVLAEDGTSRPGADG